MAEDVNDNAVTARLRDYALRYPGVEVGDVCVNRAFKAGNKSFFFMGIKPKAYNVRLKLSDSYSEAEQLANEQPDVYEPGMHGWTKATFPIEDEPPAGLLERWIDESYRNLAPKKLLTELAEKGPL